jgi:hypothetical protein
MFLLHSDNCHETKIFKTSTMLLLSYSVGMGGSFPGVKQLGREADHSPPSSAEVKE